MDEEKIMVKVCASCYKAKCWQGKQPCNAPVGMGHQEVSLEWLKKHKLENPTYWGNHVDN